MKKDTEESSPIGDEVEEIYPETCCAAIPVTLGTTILAALVIVSSTLSFSSGVLMLHDRSYLPVMAAQYSHHQLEMLAYSVIGLSMLLFFISSMAIHGVVSRKPSMVLPFFAVLAFSTVLSFVMLMDVGHRWARSNMYGSHHHFFGAMLLVLVKLYFTNAVYQCYMHLVKLTSRRLSRCGNGEARSTNTYVILPKYEDLADMQPPAYKM